eukprot:TRINITY_DN1941_c0_g1_i1.p1 TRINITY_DN1941_c0_g1~~TRINITY_DN1941_c0_g1_i1.p1  ORF type:complete len:302 (-),score=66.84 TRINITY_DN1941_c0_g1_i1:152-1057(-)
MEDLEGIRKQFRTVISVSDLWVLAANTAIKWGGPHIVTRFGRIDASEPDDGIETFADGPLPSEEQEPDVENDRDTRELLELDYLLDFFGKFGFDDPKHALAALVGGHTFGKCEMENSGLNGPWTSDAISFDNDFYVILTTATLSEQEIDNVALNNTPFGTTHQLNTLADDQTPGNTLMLYSDVAILRDPQMKDLAEQYANDQELWFEDFADYWGQLMELAWEGVLVEPTTEVATSKRCWFLKVGGVSFGIGFAIGFVVMLLGAIIYFCFCQRKNTQGDNYARLDDRERPRKGSELVGISGK